MNISCLVVDDEPLAIRVIENHIEKIPGIDLIGKSKNAIDAFEILKDKLKWGER